MRNLLLTIQTIQDWFGIPYGFRITNLVFAQATETLELCKYVRRLDFQVRIPKTLRICDEHLRMCQKLHNLRDAPRTGGTGVKLCLEPWHFAKTSGDVLGTLRKEKLQTVDVTEEKETTLEEFMRAFLIKLQTFR